MKSVNLAILAIFLAPTVYGQEPSNPPTPAQQKIAWALAAIKENPNRGQPYNDLALGYVRRVRETADTRYYDQAEKPSGNLCKSALTISRRRRRA